MSKKKTFEMHIQAFENIARDARAEIFFSGGHGGLVVYDGKGGRMTKEGGPMDRIFLLTRQGELGGNIGLDITYGNIKISTGRLANETELIGTKTKPDSVKFTFRGEPDTKSVEVRGGIPELGVPFHTVLFHASIEESVMIWILANEDSPGNLPYTAYHTECYLHPDILKRFGLSGVSITGAVSGWCKLSPAEMAFKASDKRGASFRTQQHLGCLRVFVA